MMDKIMVYYTSTDGLLKIQPKIKGNVIETVVKEFVKDKDNFETKLKNYVKLHKGYHSKNGYDIKGLTKYLFDLIIDILRAMGDVKTVHNDYKDEDKYKDNEYLDLANVFNIYTEKLPIALQYIVDVILNGKYKMIGQVFLKGDDPMNSWFLTFVNGNFGLFKLSYASNWELFRQFPFEEDDYNDYDDYDEDRDKKEIEGKIIEANKVYNDFNNNKFNNSSCDKRIAQEVMKEVVFNKVDRETDIPKDVLNLMKEF